LAHATRSGNAAKHLSRASSISLFEAILAPGAKKNAFLRSRIGADGRTSGLRGLAAHYVGLIEPEARAFTQVSKTTALANFVDLPLGNRGIPPNSRRLLGDNDIVPPFFFFSKKRCIAASGEQRKQHADFTQSQALRHVSSLVGEFITTALRNRFVFDIYDPGPSSF